jgi:phosphonatase-like hydrolase
MKPSLVVFDIAGTTVVDPDVVNTCLRRALLSHHVDVTRNDVNAYMGISKPLAIRELAERSLGRPLSDEEVEVIFQDFRMAMLDYYTNDEGVHEVDGATDLFKKLKEQGIKVALDTGFDREIADAVIDRMGWNDSLLDATVTSDEVEKGRPHPDMVFRLMRDLGIESSEDVAKVGDTPSDLQEGQASGCGFVIGVTSGTHTAEELARYPHTHLVASLGEIEGIVVGQPVKTN